MRNQVNNDAAEKAKAKLQAKVRHCSHVIGNHAKRASVGRVMHMCNCDLCSCARRILDGVRNGPKKDEPRTS